MTKLSYADWLDGDARNVSSNVVDWERDQLWIQYAQAIQEFAQKIPTAFGSILELGCGAGYLAQHLGNTCPGVAYTGVDMSRSMMKLAESKQNGRESTLFIDADLTTDPRLPDVDLVCSFAVMKHFSLEQLERVFKIFRHGKYNLHTFAIGPQDTDDGPGYVHQWISNATLEMILNQAGQKIIWQKDRVRVDAQRADVYIGTERKPMVGKSFVYKSDYDPGEAAETVHDTPEPEEVRKPRPRSKRPL